MTKPKGFLAQPNQLNYYNFFVAHFFLYGIISTSSILLITGRITASIRITKKTMQENDAKFLEIVVKALVDAPDKVKITRTVDEMGVLLTLVVDNADMGKVIGRSGNTAKAIRTLLRVVGMKNNSRVNLKINEPDGAAPRMATVSKEPTTKTVDEAMADLKL